MVKMCVFSSGELLRTFLSKRSCSYIACVINGGNSPEIPRSAHMISANCNHSLFKHTDRNDQHENTPTIDGITRGISRRIPPPNKEEVKKKNIQKSQENAF